MDFVKFMILRT